MSEHDDYTLHETTQPALARMRAHHTPYEVIVGGLSLTVMPGVWSPAYDWSGGFMAEHLPNLTGKDILEIGCGSGVVSVHAANKGARHVTAVDISETAVANTRLNLDRNGCQHAIVKVSDVFNDVDGTYDVIVFNAPYHGCRPADMLERAVADEDYRSLKQFFAGVAEHIRPTGCLFVGFSESGDLSMFRELVSRHGWSVRAEFSEWHSGYNCMVFELARVASTG